MEMTTPRTVTLERDHLVNGTPGLTADGEELFRALARGLTDDAICHALGWSRRKFRRVLTTTMADIGAQSRFQAGYLFGRNETK